VAFARPDTLDKKTIFKIGQTQLGIIIEEAMKLLLHVCCAPDATWPLQVLKDESQWEEVVGYFYGSNIHPADEFRRRAEAVNFLSEQCQVKVLTRPYAPEEWFVEASPLAHEPERGARCSVCFAMQLRAAAEEAVKRGASHVSTTLTISPHKNISLISRLGSEIAASFNLTWEDRIWRKNGGFLQSIRMSKAFNLYRQNYCGCVYSIR
jgi:predicted adenine nucleotide alpha hydrolase (AANH) superfamily ATPase